MSWLGFVLIFLGAASARLGATHCQALVAARTAGHGIDAPHGFRHFLLHQATPDFRRFMLFSGLVHWAVLISGPFFVIYLLRDLHWTYLHYAGWMAASILGQFTTLKPWGQFGDRYGNKNLLRVTAFAVPVLPMAYLVSGQYPYLLGVNFFGGIVWAGLSLGLQNYVFDSLRPEERTRGVALANAMNAIGWGLGALTGSWLATIVPAQLRFAFWDLTPASNLPFVFFISGLLRLAIAISMLGRFGEPRKIETMSQGELVRELPLIKPLMARWPSRSPR
ncbi:MAG: MFS transporter [Nitrospiraceae bacterium]